MSRKLVLYLLFVVLFTVLAGEILLRIMGYTPWSPKPVEDDVIYHPKSPFYLDTVLGYKMHTGIYDIIYGHEYTFRVTIDSDGYRIVPSFNKNSKRRLLIFGDSFTLGSGLNDEETYPSLLQDSLPDFRIRNYAIPGYGVANVFTQLTSLFPPDSGDVCMYSYFKQHNNRYIRTVLKMMYAQPQLMGSLGFMRLSRNNGSITSVFQPYNYKMWKLSPYSSLSNLLEDYYNRLKDEEENRTYEVLAQQAILEMDSICRASGATFILCGIRREDGTEQMLDFCKKGGINTIDISVDLNDNKYNQMPYDDHPNALSNTLFAERILEYLRSGIVPGIRN